MRRRIARHPLFVIIGLFVNNIDTNPKLQNRIHTFGFWYWTINFPLITYLFFFQQDLWLKYGLFITLIYSIYANWTSDYTGMSASQSLVSDLKQVTTTEVYTQQTDQVVSPVNIQVNEDGTLSPVNPNKPSSYTN
jgi:hypothetical protein